MEHRTTASDHSHWHYASNHESRRGIPADEWHICSKIFTEGRRIRCLITELRTLLSNDLSPASRHALEQYVRSLETSAALGDIAADALVARRD